MYFIQVKVSHLVSLGFVLVVVSGCASMRGDLPVGDEVDFVRHIKPILEGRCIQCHNRSSMPARVSFESRELALAPGKRGRAIVPGDPDSSLVVNFINAPRDTQEAMPRTGHEVSEQEAETIREWIAAGAAWPNGPQGHLSPRR